MKIYRVDLVRDGLQGLPEVTPEARRAVALGYFDGVHLGHAELIRRLVYTARQSGLTPAVFTFDRFPKPLPPDAPLIVSEALPLERLVDAPIHEAPDARDRLGDPNVPQSPLAPAFYDFKGLLQPLSERIRMFAALGVEELYLQAYTEDFVTVEPEPFLDRILRDALDARLIVTGSDYTFGRMGRGTVADLVAWCDRNAVRHIEVPPVYAGGRVVSSSAIRDQIVAGDFGMANRMLGRPFVMQGVVIHGRALGRTVGMPTANTRIAEGQVMPPYGVYLTRTRVDGRVYPSVTNIGMRPTVNQTDPKPLLETCLIDVAMDLYDKLIDVEFLRFMRPELKYPSFLAMSAQIAQDIVDARALHQTLDQPWEVERDPAGYGLYLRNSDRFSQCTLDVIFQAPATAERLAAAQLLSRVMTATTEAYPARADLARMLDYHYGLTLTEEVYTQGDLATVAFHVSGIRRGLDASRPFRFGTDLLMSMILTPHRDEDGAFPAAVTEVERQNLLMERRSFDQDRDEAVLRRAWLLTLDEGDPRALSELGDPAWIRPLTAEDLERMWHELLHDWEVNIYLSGDVGADTLEGVRAHARTLPLNPDRFRRIPGVMPSPPTLPQERTLTEQQPGEQAMLVMIYAGLPQYSSLDIWTARVLNTLIGGGPHALLFEVVREQKALCYTIDSHVDYWNSALVIGSRLYPADVAEAVRAIREVVDAVAAGQLEDQDWVSARMLVEAEVLSGGDEIMLMGPTLNTVQTLGQAYDPEGAIDALRRLTREDVIRVARDLRLMTTYVQVPETEGSL